MPKTQVIFFKEESGEIPIIDEFLTIAVSAKQEGKRIAIVDEDGTIDTEITGF